MEVGKQIKAHRAALGLSQEELAETIYVSRQTISNWENDRNYPDVKSLVLLSETFDISLDQLVKGDLEEMKEQIKTEDVKKFQREGNVFAVLLLGTMLLPLPLLWWLGTWGLLLWGLWAAVAIGYAVRVEKSKKRYDVQTYREILAFTQGESLSAAEKNQEIGKRPYQTAAYAIGAALLTLAVSAGMILLKAFLT